MARKPYEPDAFDLLGGEPLPGGTIQKDLDKAEFWKSRGIPSEDALDRLETEEKIKAMGWSCTYGQGVDREGKPIVGRVMNPETAASESEWEASNVQLQKEQIAELPGWMAENLPPKESGRTDGGNFTLRTTPNEAPQNVPKYEDSAECAALRRAGREITRS